MIHLEGGNLRQISNCLLILLAIFSPGSYTQVVRLFSSTYHIAGGYVDCGPSGRRTTLTPLLTQCSSSRWERSRSYLP